MKLIIGLGNPGPRYARTRHNLGFRVVEELARRHHLNFDKRRANARVAQGQIVGEDVVLAKPQTFMNLSGRSVANLRRAFPGPNSNLLIIYDDLDLPLGKIRLRERGSAAGHKGLESVKDYLKTSAFCRLKVGIGRPGLRQDPIEYVLSPFSREEEKSLAEVVPLAATAVETWLIEGPTVAMNKYN